jgi:hypothetical protein
MVILKWKKNKLNKDNTKLTGQMNILWNISK